MKTEKQRKRDFKIESKALKADIKTAKKEVSKINKSLKRNAKAIANAERELGHWYYQEWKHSTAEGRRKLERYCAVISTAEKDITEFAKRKEIAVLRVAARKAELKQKKKALKHPDVTHIEIVD